MQKKIECSFRMMELTRREAERDPQGYERGGPSGTAENLICELIEWYELVVVIAGSLAKGRQGPQRFILVIVDYPSDEESSLAPLKDLAL